MRIDEQLNVQIPIDRADGSVVWVHATPISQQVFEMYWMILAKVHAQIYGMGLSIIAGPRIAALMLKEIAIQSGSWEGPTGVAIGLMAEMRRLANVIVPQKDGGWAPFPLDVARQHGMLAPEDAAEVEGILVFFSLGWRMHRRNERVAILEGAMRLWGASTSSANLSDFVASLLISKETASTGETPPTTSPQPSSTGGPVLVLKSA